jgi:hypothetical protein
MEYHFPVDIHMKTCVPCLVFYWFDRFLSFIIPENFNPQLNNYFFGHFTSVASYVAHDFCQIKYVQWIPTMLTTCHGSVVWHTVITFFFGLLFAMSPLMNPSRPHHTVDFSGSKHSFTFFFSLLFAMSPLMNPSRLQHTVDFSGTKQSFVLHLKCNGML